MAAERFKPAKTCNALHLATNRFLIGVVTRDPYWSTRVLSLKGKFSPVIVLITPFSTTYECSDMAKRDRFELIGGTITCS